jgi:hypothetical protein
LKKYEEELKNFRAMDQAKIVAEIEEVEPLLVVDDNRESELIQKQLEKYKQLLLKQRDIMIALTSRLNNRDETILQLRSELEMFYAEKMPNNNLNADSIEKNSYPMGAGRIGAYGYSQQYTNSISHNSSIDKDANFAGAGGHKFSGNLLEFGANFGPQNHSSDDGFPTEGNSTNSALDKKSRDSIEKTLKSISFAENLSSDLCNGLDDIINSLTKQNDSLNLHKIAQSILELQKKSHNLKGVIIESSNETKTTFHLTENHSNVLQNQNQNLINICTFSSNQNNKEDESCEEGSLYSPAKNQDFEPPNQNQKNNFYSKNSFNGDFGNSCIIGDENYYNNKPSLSDEGGCPSLKRAKSDYCANNFDKENAGGCVNSKVEKNNNAGGFINSYFLRDKHKNNLR